MCLQSFPVSNDVIGTLSGLHAVLSLIRCFRLTLSCSMNFFNKGSLDPLYYLNETCTKEWSEYIYLIIYVDCVFEKGSCTCM